MYNIAKVFGKNREYHLSPCCMSILQYVNVACPCRLFSPVSYVEFKKSQCHMSLLFLPSVVYHYQSPICVKLSIKEMAVPPCHF